MTRAEQNSEFLAKLAKREMDMLLLLFINFVKRRRIEFSLLASHIRVAFGQGPELDDRDENVSIYNIIVIFRLSLRRGSFTHKPYPAL